MPSINAHLYYYMYMYIYSESLTNGGESDSHLCLLANLTEDRSLAVFGDVVCHFKVTKSTWRKGKEGKKERGGESAIWKEIQTFAE